MSNDIQLKIDQAILATLAEEKKLPIAFYSKGGRACPRQTKEGGI